MIQRFLIILIGLVGLSLFFPVSPETSELENPGKPSGDVSDDEMTFVIRTMLERVIEQVRNNEYDDVIQENKIVLSTEHIKEQWVPETISAVSIQLMDPEEIQKKANCKCDFKYLVFSKISIKTSKILVSLGDTCAWIKNCDSILTFGSSETWEYHQENGKWVGELISAAIS
jgi:hypothetical protein